MFFKVSPFSISWFVLTRKQKSVVVNWRMGDAQSTVHMQDGTCELARGKVHMSTPSISSFSNMQQEMVINKNCTGRTAVHMYHH